MGDCLSPSLRSKRFREAKSEERGFRRFAREKNGARAKNRKEGVGDLPITADVLKKGKIVGNKSN